MSVPQIRLEAREHGEAEAPPIRTQAEWRGEELKILTPRAGQFEGGQNGVVQSKTATKAARKQLLEPNRPLDGRTTTTSLLELARSYQQTSVGKEARTPTGNAPDSFSAQPAHLVSLPSIEHRLPEATSLGGSCSPMTR